MSDAGEIRATPTGRLAAVRLLIGMSWRVDRVRTSVVVVLIVAQTAADGLVSLSLRNIVDSAVTGAAGSAVVAAVVGGLALAVGMAGGRVVTSLQMDLTERIGLMLAREVLNLSAGLHRLEHLERPAYLDRVEILRKEIYSLAQFAWITLGAVSLVVRVLISVWLLGTVHPLLLLLAGLVFVPLLLARVGQRWVQQSVTATAAPTRLERHLFTLCTTAVPGKELRVFGSGPELDTRATGLWNEITAVRVRARVLAALTGLLGGLVFVSGYTGALILVTVLALRGQTTPGDIVLVVSLASQLRGQTGALAETFGQFATGVYILDQYLWLRDYAAAESSQNADAAVPDRLCRGIDFDGLAFRYPDTDREVLADVTVQLPAGAVVALVGEHGAGKTTLVKLLCGFYQPTLGQIRVDGVPLEDIRPDEWLRHVSAAFQDFGRFEFLARETVGVGDVPHIEDEQRVRRALRRADAADVLAGLPRGFETQLGRTFPDGVELSTGQWQKFALSRGFMRDQPLLMVLDEPTAALDARAEQSLFERYAVRARELGAACGTITILVSHRFSTVRMADLIIVLEGGKVTECGTHDALLASLGRYAELYRMQASGYE